MRTFLEPVFWTFVLRMIQAFIWASPYVLFGICAAGVLRAFVRPHELRAAFNGSTWAGRIRLWLLAILLPWSSFGVLPAARQLQRAGVRRRAVMAFVLIAPVVNVLTAAYAFSTMSVAAAIVFVAGAVAVPVLVAALCGRAVFPDEDRQQPAAEPRPPAAHQRLALAFITAARELTGPMFTDLLIGLVGVGLLAVLVPGDLLEHTLAKPGWLAPPLAVLVAIPAYLSPHQGMMVAGVAFSEGNSLGAAFVLLALGAGVNLGWLARIGRGFGAERLAFLLAVLIVFTVLYGYGTDAVLPHLRTSLNHHHALTDLGPVEGMASGAEAFDQFLRRVRREVGPPEQIALWGIGVLAVAGLTLRLVDQQGRITKRLLSPAARSADATPPWWNPSLSRGTLVASGIVCTLALLIASLYVYFPSPDALLVDLQYTSTDVYVCGIRGDKQQAMQRMDKLEGLMGELRASAIVRRRLLTAECRRQTDRLRQCTLALRQAVDSGGNEQSRAASFAFDRTLRDFHRAYDPPASRVLTGNVN